MNNHPMRSKICQNCGTELSSDCLYCENFDCQINTNAICSQCGNILQYNTEVCESCGKHIEGLVYDELELIDKEICQLDFHKISIRRLKCQKLNIDILDLRDVNNLRILKCDACKNLRKIDISKNEVLIELSCWSNQLEESILIIMYAYRKLIVLIII